MDPTQYRDAVVANRREQGFETVDEYTNGFDPVWAARDDDPSVGECRARSTLVDESDPDPDDITAIADEFRVLVERVDDRRGRRRRSGTSPSPCGTPISRSSTRRGRTVARRRTNVFPIVYDCEAETLHRHEIPRLKGRGIYRRQAKDAERLFDI